jgi:hypothetical protein
MVTFFFFFFLASSLSLMARPVPEKAAKAAIAPRRVRP